MSSPAPAPAGAPPVTAPPPKKSRTDGVEYNFCYALKQQLLRAWQPVPTLGCGIIMFFLLGLAFGGGGVYLYILNDQIWEFRERYDARCGAVPQCEVLFTVPSEKTKTFIYYEINGFYQSHRKFFGSKSQLQLTGQAIVEADASSCKPVIKNADLYKKTNWNESAQLDPTKVAYPCGAFARAIFNDTYVIQKLTSSGAVESTPTITFKGIAWQQDPGYTYKNLAGSQKSDQWIDVESEAFIVWMRAAPTPKFRKLYGILAQPLAAGNYKVIVQNNWPVSGFSGEKYFVISQANMFGGKNTLLCFLYLGIGVLMLLTAIFFGIRKGMRSNGILEANLK